MTLTARSETIEFDLQLFATPRNKNVYSFHLRQETAEWRDKIMNFLAAIKILRQIYLQTFRNKVLKEKHSFWKEITWLYWNARMSSTLPSKLGQLLAPRYGSTFWRTNDTDDCIRKQPFLKSFAYNVQCKTQWIDSGQISITD